MAKAERARVKVEAEARANRLLSKALPYAPSTSIMRVNDPLGPSTRWQIRERAFDEHYTHLCMINSKPGKEHRKAQKQWLKSLEIYEKSVPDPTSYLLLVRDTEKGIAKNNDMPTPRNCDEHVVCTEERCPEQQHYYEVLAQKGLLPPVKHVHWGGLHFEPEVMVHARVSDEGFRPLQKP